MDGFYVLSAIHPATEDAIYYDGQSWDPDPQNAKQYGSATLEYARGMVSRKFPHLAIYGIPRNSIRSNCLRCDGDGMAVMGIEDVYPCPSCGGYNG
jgi:hypothetical protein